MTRPHIRPRAVHLPDSTASTMSKGEREELQRIWAWSSRSRNSRSASSGSRQSFSPVMTPPAGRDAVSASPLLAVVPMIHGVPLSVHGRERATACGGCRRVRRSTGQGRLRQRPLPSARCQSTLADELRYLARKGRPRREANTSSTLRSARLGAVQRLCQKSLSDEVELSAWCVTFLFGRDSPGLVGT
jgi:hypothetical protein